MPSKKTAAPLLDARQAAFLGGPLSIGLASHGADGRPSLSRAYGCRVSADRREVVIYVSRRRAAELLRDVAAGAPVAAVFSRPATHETLQLKAARARVRAVAAADAAAMAASGAAFAAELTALGYPEAFLSAMLAPLRDEAMAVAFCPEGAFEQTPGPAAGRRLEPGA
ncbi:hypothetical protein EZJ19_08840 [Parasulfuritortus cantonensis]|uniref:Pyridoxamine 5'-phosphate oxidase putative domain-containing protein n=1 Tax=Parasulfuritortus cantonensis TaxID=2528202 RepID=A0A4R1BD13_9PROT|nr:hypothetical protein [Parasulfuritortus cantonensis]TCJ14975.1 hypothetical protein EZJ19_08840 [Parasulfuritortus cantonensis]